MTLLGKPELTNGSVDPSQNTFDDSAYSVQPAQHQLWKIKGMTHLHRDDKSEY